MTTAAARTRSPMTVGDFLEWTEEQADDARFELIAGVPVRLMAPTSIRHARIRRNVSETLRDAIARLTYDVRSSIQVPGSRLAQMVMNVGSRTWW